MSAIKLIPSLKEAIWGGKKLFSWGKDNGKDNIAETWELSFNEKGPSMIAGTDKYLKEVVSKEELGPKCSKFPFFPMLIKLIDTLDDLSVQVHPSDEYALKHENSYGKTEMWYIIDNEPGAGLYLGLKEDISKELFEERIKNDTLTDVLNFFEVKPGDVYFVESGTIHAVGRGVTLIEIQQNIARTYRIYDFNRKDKDGNSRELHIEKAKEVTNLHKFTPKKFDYPCIGKCDYFASYVYNLDGQHEIKADKGSFISFTFLEGSGEVDGISFNKGDTFFLKNNDICLIKGKGRFVLSTVE